MDLGLSGKRFLVTGGTRGIGRAVVEGLLAEGAAVAYCARTPDAVAETQSALTADGTIAIGSAVDVGDAAALTDWVNSSFTALGGIDGVVASVSALAIPESTENWHTSFDVDLMGTEGLTLSFTEDAIDALADIAVAVNSSVENIGARRLHTVLERVLDEISFDASDRDGQTVVVDGNYVRARVGELARNADLSKFIL